MKMTLLKMGRARWTAGAAIALLALGVLGSAPALAGIATTKHNLGSNGTGDNKFSGTGEICVFCHTPHGADITATAPLWNRSLVTATTYQTYNSLGTSSLDGATAPVGSVSLACLSCHDGTQAMNVMINQPGSGTVVTTFGAGTWTGSGKLNGTTITNIGTDLQNDHPVGIQYGGGYGTGTEAYPKNLVADGGFRDKDFKGVQYNNLNGNDVWWVDTGPTGLKTREKTDMQLYTRKSFTSVGTGAATITGPQAMVECASCHDPHSSANATFLRIDNASSAVCLACHIK